MIGLIERRDSFGDISHFTIVGRNQSSLFDQMSELNSHAYDCDTGNHFKLVAYKENGEWFSNDGKPWKGLAIKLKEEGVI